MVKYLKLLPLLFLLGCAPKIEPIQIPKAEFDKTQSFNIEEHIEKPTRPDFILLNKDFEITQNNDEAEYFAFTPNEFAKIIALSTSFDSQREMIDQLENIVNLRIDEINALKELVATKEVLSEHLAVLYANEQTIRQIESRNYTIERLSNRLVMILQTGAIIALAIAL